MAALCESHKLAANFNIKSGTAAAPRLIPSSSFSEHSMVRSACSQSHFLPPSGLSHLLVALERQHVQRVQCGRLGLRLLAPPLLLRLLPAAAVVDDKADDAGEVRGWDCSISCRGVHLRCTPPGDRASMFG